MDWVARFCGQDIPHYAHVFYRDSGAYIGSANYHCPGRVPAVIHEDADELSE